MGFSSAEYESRQIFGTSSSFDKHVGWGCVFFPGGVWDLLHNSSVKCAIAVTALLGPGRGSLILVCSR